MGTEPYNKGSTVRWQAYLKCVVMLCIGNKMSRGICRWIIKRIVLARLASALDLFYGAIERVVAHSEADCESIRRWRTPVLREMIWR